MPATFTTPLITVISGQTITASLWNNEYNNISTNFIPAGMDDASGTDPEMQTTADPYPASATSRPTSLLGEIYRLRYLVTQITGGTYWYVDPVVDLTTFKTRFDAHTHDGTANNGPQIAAAGLAANSVTTVKILDANVTVAKLAALSVDATKITTSAVGNGLTGGAGVALAVSVDSSTIEINAGALRVKDAGITSAKLATGILHVPLTNVSANITATTVNGTYGTVLSVSGSGTLKGITLKSFRSGGASGGATFSIRITLDGVQYVVAGLTSNNVAIYSIINAAWANTQPPTLANYFTSVLSAGTGADFNYGYKTSMLIELNATSFTDGNNGFYVCTSYEG